MLENGMAVSIGRLRPDTQYDYNQQETSLLKTQSHQTRLALTVFASVRNYVKCQSLPSPVVKRLRTVYAQNLRKTILK